MASTNSIIDQRNIIVQQNIPKLVKNLTKFNTTDENFKTCVQFAFSQVKYHRYLTVNSHEIKRDIDGICEKLRFSSLHDTEKKFKKMVEECVTSELAVQHYEKDVMYSILNLLITLAYDPITNIKDKLRKGQSIVTLKPVSKVASTVSDTFVSSLLKDNFKVQRTETDSELSEWTDSEDDSEDHSQLEQVSDESQASPEKSRLASSLKPPQKPEVFRTIKLENSDKWLRDNIQNSWWFNEMTTTPINSTHPVANFCTLWQKYLSEKSVGFIKPKPFSQISEYCLLREIFWMFLNPVDCKFFKMDVDEISLRADVTLPSTMPESLHFFLDDILRSINLVNRLRIVYARSCRSSILSHTMETYFNVVKNLLDEILEFVLREEEVVKAQEQTYTIIIFHNKLRPHAKMLDILWNIHSTSTLDEVNYPPHICSSYLLASLNRHVQTSCMKEQKNLAIFLLVKCLRAYLEIFDVWWTEARLSDLKQEFLVEKINVDEEEVTQPRLLKKSKDKSFFVNDEVSNRVTNDSIVTTMLNFSVKASFTLDTISKMDRVHEMKQIANDSTSLYDEFVKRIDSEIRKFSLMHEASDETFHSQEESKNLQLVEDIKNGMLEHGDHLMILAFQSTFDRLLGQKPAPEAPQTKLLEVLNKASEFILLPLERSIQRIIDELLSRKISIAERFVMNIYLHELHVDHSLQELRKVFFLESSELVNFFNQKVFLQIEAGEKSWASSYLLTMALNDAICHCRNHTSTSLFSVEVGKKFDYHSVLQAVDDLTVFFNVHKNLENIFPKQLMEKYNEVFRFLLKIKWGQRTLANLRFPDFFKHRAPYAKMQMIDLVIKRLSLTRFAMQHSINTLHNHLTVTLGGLCYQLDAKVAKVQNVPELIAHHEAFVNTFQEQSFLCPESRNVYGIIIEILKLTKVMKDEWDNIIKFASLDEFGGVDSISLMDLNSNSIQIEKAFGACECQLKVLFDF